MSKKTPCTESDKLTNIKNWIKSVLSSQRIVDKSGNILNIDAYRQVIDNEINKRELTLMKISAPNYVVEDKDFASVLFGEIAFLKEIKTYTKNINPLVENPLELRANRVTDADDYGFRDLFHDLNIIRHRLSKKIKDPTTR